MNVIFLGPPGSGKGTQAKRLAEVFKLAHLSTGDIFRDAIASGNELGLEIKSFVDAGKLVPDELVSEVVFEKIKSMDRNAGFLLDGYPRTVDQAKAFADFSKRQGFSLDHVISMEINSETLIKRLSARRHCSKCKDVYNLEGRRPKVENKCDSCGGELSQRPDDRAEIVQERLRVYDRQTKPILDYYKIHPAFRRVNADQEIDRVYSDIVEAVSASGPKAKGE